MKKGDLVVTHPTSVPLMTYVQLLSSTHPRSPEVFMCEKPKSVTFARNLVQPHPLRQPGSRPHPAINLASTKHVVGCCTCRFLLCLRCQGWAGRAGPNLVLPSTKMFCDLTSPCTNG
eukprot:3600030-Rhodomonas_salina.5